MEPILRTADTADWISILLLSSLVFPVLAKGFFYGRFMNFIILPFNNKYIFLYNKKEKLVNWFHILFSAFLVINFSLFLFFARSIFISPDDYSRPSLYTLILASIMAFILLKVFLQMGNGFIFGSSKAISELVFKKLSYLNYSGIVMFFANLILAYTAKTSEIVVYVAIFLIVLINVIGWITLLKNHQKLLANYFFYFILYLCALEIAPFIIIGSYLKQ